MKRERPLYKVEREYRVVDKFGTVRDVSSSRRNARKWRALCVRRIPELGPFVIELRTIFTQHVR